MQHTLEVDNVMYEMSQPKRDTLMVHGVLRQLEGDDTYGTYRLATAEEMSDDINSTFYHDPMAADAGITIFRALLSLGED